MEIPSGVASACQLSQSMTQPDRITPVCPSQATQPFVGTLILRTVRHTPAQLQAEATSWGAESFKQFTCYDKNQCRDGLGGTVFLLLGSTINEHSLPTKQSSEAQLRIAWERYLPGDADSSRIGPQNSKATCQPQSFRVTALLRQQGYSNAFDNKGGRLADLATDIRLRPQDSWFHGPIPKDRKPQFDWKGAVVWTKGTMMVLRVKVNEFTNGDFDPSGKKINTTSMRMQIGLALQPMSRTGKIRPHVVHCL